jgi:hypothetical protein
VVGDRGLAAQIDGDDLFGLAVVEGRDDRVEQGRFGDGRFDGGGLGRLGLLGDNLSP